MSPCGWRPLGTRTWFRCSTSKSWRTSRSRAGRGSPPEVVVGRLADKTPSNFTPNVHHRLLVDAELAGQKIQMTHRPVIRGGDVKRASDGKVRLHVEGFPEQAALLRWQRHDFDAGAASRQAVALRTRRAGPRSDG